MRALIFALALALLSTCAIRPAQAAACEFSLAGEQAKWAERGINVRKLHAPTVLYVIKLRLGETVEADQVFLLTMKDAPNAMLVFVVNSCVTQAGVFSVEQIEELFRGWSV